MSTAEPNLQPTAESVRSTTSSSEQGDALLAYVAPFGLYMLLTSIESSGWLGVRYEAWYCIKAAVVAGALFWFRKAYPPFSTRGFGLAIVAGVAGIAVWLGLAWLQGEIPGLNDALAKVFGTRSGFNPFGEEGATPARIGFVVVRLIGLILIVPVMEEIFWRGFLARYVINEKFLTVPQGHFSPGSFVIVTAAFVAVHPELLAAAAWGSLINLLYQRTQNLWACVVMHATTNALLGAWILSTGDWKLW